MAFPEEAGLPYGDAQANGPSGPEPLSSGSQTSPLSSFRLPLSSDSSWLPFWLIYVGQNERKSPLGFLGQGLPSKQTKHFTCSV